MAPEIVRGQAKASTETDLFSLAVLLFYMLFMHHPLEGAREAANEEHRFSQYLLGVVNSAPFRMRRAAL